MLLNLFRLAGIFILGSFMYALLPETWRIDCEICGRYVGYCEEFTIAKETSDVVLFSTCGSTPRKPIFESINYKLTTDSGDPEKAFTLETQSSKRAGRNVMYVRRDADSKGLGTWTSIDFSIHPPRSFDRKLN